MIVNGHRKGRDDGAILLTNIGEWDGVDIVGLQEVENALCVKRLCYTLRRGEYDFVHYESPDARGIDVALIYKKSRVDTIATRAIKVKGERVNGERLITRDILYVCAQIDKRDTVHFFVCHLPSQLYVRKSISEIRFISLCVIYQVNEAGKQRVNGREE